MLVAGPGRRHGCTARSSEPIRTLATMPGTSSEGGRSDTTLPGKLDRDDVRLLDLRRLIEELGCLGH